MTPPSKFRGVRFVWLWNDVYKGVELQFGEQRALWLGYTKYTYRKRGW